MYTDHVLHHDKIIRHCFNYLRTQFDNSAGICKQSKCPQHTNVKHPMLIYN